MNTLKEIDGKLYDTCKVVMLPSEKAIWPNCIWLGAFSKILRLDTSYKDFVSKKPVDKSMLPQHIYIFGDGPILPGDWIYHPLDERVFHVSNEPQYLDKEALKRYGYKKVIASTDPDLACHYGNDGERFGMMKGGLPRPSLKFIKAYIKAYNTKKPILSVLVEVDFNGPVIELGRVSIKKDKIQWTRDEVIEFGLACVNLGMDLQSNPLPRLNKMTGKQYYMNWLIDKL